MYKEKSIARHKFYITKVKNSLPAKLHKQVARVDEENIAPPDEYWPTFMLRAAGVLLECCW